MPAAADEELHQPTGDRSAAIDALGINAALLSVLRALRIKGYAEVPAIAAFSDLAERDVTTQLDAALQAGRVQRREGRVHGFGLTPAGKEVHAALTVAAIAEPAVRATFEPADASFLALNAPMKSLCTRWQLENQPPACIAELAALHSRAMLILVDLAALAPRFAAYRRRFAAALERLQGGDASAFLRPLSDSYHDIWMEWHQDLLLTLGRTRGAADGH